MKKNPNILLSINEESHMTLLIKQERHIATLIRFFPEEEIIKPVYLNLVSRLFKTNTFSCEEAQDFVYAQLKGAIDLGFTNFAPLTHISDNLIVATLNSISKFKRF